MQCWFSLIFVCGSIWCGLIWFEFGFWVEFGVGFGFESEFEFEFISNNIHNSLALGPNSILSPNSDFIL